MKVREHKREHSFIITGTYQEGITVEAVTRKAALRKILKEGVYNVYPSELSGVDNLEPTLLTDPETNRDYCV